MNSLWDIRIFLGLVPKESLCIINILMCYTEFIYNFILSFMFNGNGRRHDREYWSVWVTCFGLILSSDTFLEWRRKSMKNVRWPNQFPCVKSKVCNKNSSITSVCSRRDGLKRVCSKSDQHAWQRGNWCTIAISNRNVTCIYTILIKIPDVLKAQFFMLFFWDKLLYILTSS
jgi:hypothetical protein